MSHTLSCDEDLIRRLPLPLAKLYRRAHNAKNAQDRHQAAFYLWEAGLKLLGSVAVVMYAERGQHDAVLDKALEKLARPAIGNWWEFVRKLVPALAEAGDDGFQRVRELILGRARSDCPRLSRLDADLRGVIENVPDLRGTVRLSDLFERMVTYRNRELGHGAAGLRSPEFYDRMGRAILDAMDELFARLDCLAGRRLLLVDDVRREADGRWLIERFELVAETRRRVESLERPERETSQLPVPQRIYLDAGSARRGSASADATEVAPDDDVPRLTLHPLILYDRDTDEVLFLNARRNNQRTEYLCYTNGLHLQRKELIDDQQSFIARILGEPVDAAKLQQFSAASMVEEIGAAATADHEPGDSPAAKRTVKAPPRQVGEFELLSELGRGNMGVVYRAWQPSLGRQVALKCSMRVGDPKAVDRFHREIQALGRVEHPNLVKIFTKGVEGEQWYFAMELIEGASLGAVWEVIGDTLRSRSSAASAIDLETWQECLSSACEQARQAERPLSGETSEGISRAKKSSDSLTTKLREDVLTGRDYVRHVVALVRQVALAAHALHEDGIVHRDIKPANIMVTGDGEQAVLMDLGLAQMVDDAQGKLTRTRQFVGSLRYASPEQVLAVGQLDRRTDVYSLGATLWELLTLCPMFGATDQVSTPELMRRITTDEPEPLRKHHPGIARDLEAIVAKCLEKRPDRRYPAAANLARDLQRFLAFEPVEARPVGTFERWVKWIHRRPLEAAFAGVSGVAALALLVLGGFYLYNSGLEKTLGDVERQRDIAKTQTALADREKQRAERSLSQAERERKLSEQSFQFAHDALLRIIDTAERELGRRVEMQPLRREMLTIVLPYYTMALERWGDDPKHQVPLGEALMRLTSIETVTELEKDTAFYQRAIHILEGLVQRQPGNAGFRSALAFFHHNLGSVFSDTGRTEEALKSFHNALKLRDYLVASAPGNRAYRRDLARSHGYIGDVYLQSGRLKEAEDAYLNSHEVRKSLAEEFRDDRDYQCQLARSFGNLGWLARMKGKTSDAVAEYRRGLEIQEGLVKDEPLRDDFLNDLAYTRRQIARFQLEDGQAEAAVESYRSAEEAYRTLLKHKSAVAPYQLGLATTLVGLGFARLEAGQDRNEIRDAHDKAAEILDPLASQVGDLTEYRNDSACNDELLGRLQLADGQLDDAQESLRRALGFQQRLVEDNPQNPDFLSDLGAIQADLASALARQDRPHEVAELLKHARDSQQSARAKAGDVALYRHRLHAVDKFQAGPEVDRAKTHGGESPSSGGPR